MKILKNKIIHICTTILMIIILGSIIIINCGGEKVLADSIKKERERIQTIYKNGNIFIVQDTQTGIEYLIYASWQYGATITPLYAASTEFYRERE